jgi:hypothetical protein
VRAIPRFFAAASVLLAVTMTVSACDVSPYAAKVGSQVIKQTALNAELRAWAANRQYVSAFDANNRNSPQCQQNAAACVAVTGDAPGTYNSEWVSSILSDMITASAVQQRLQATGRHVSPAGLQAARAVSEISQIGWTNFPPSFRDTLVSRLAEQALITPPLAQLSQAFGQVYQQYKQYFFARVCVLQAAAFTLAQAETLSSGSRIVGQPVCYSQAQLELQPPAVRQAIMALPVGQVSQPVKTPYGYLVVKVASRDVIGLTNELKRTISVAIIDAQGVPNDTVDALMAHVKVKINPAYGTWDPTQVPPAVLPPKAPGSSAA